MAAAFIKSCVPLKRAQGASPSLSIEYLQQVIGVEGLQDEPNVSLNVDRLQAGVGHVHQPPGMLLSSAVF